MYKYLLQGDASSTRTPKSSGRKCEYVLLPCQHCGNELSRYLLIIHQINCPKATLECKEGCGKVITRESMKDHYGEECPMAVLPCNYASWGCMYEGSLKGRKSHTNSSTKQHFQLAAEKIKSLEHSNELFVKRIESLENKDVSFVWRISDYKPFPEKVLKSKTFHTSEFGYRLRLKAHFSGYGAGAGTHLSLFLKPRKGDYDSILKWPLKLEYCLSLLPQEKGYQTIDHSHAYSFLCPTKARNVGADKFVSHKTLAECGYVKDGVLFIKCVAKICVE